MNEARRRGRSFIQAIHLYRDEYLRSGSVPEEHVVVFDEAQRAWTQDKISKFMRERSGIQNFDKSEPRFLIEILDLRPDWCVIVCLIGGGQEINEGEAGLSEWFMPLSKHYKDWKIRTSDQLMKPEYSWGLNLQSMIEGLDYSCEQDLHLAVSVRSFRAERLSQFINELIAGDKFAASNTYEFIKASYPIVLTRRLSIARSWLRQRARGSERY